MIKIWLPFPPSVNSLYAGKARRHKSKRYIEWENEAEHALQSQNIKDKESGSIQITYRFGPPDKRVRDVFNFEKACSDFLVKKGIIFDDSLIQRGVVEWGVCPGVEVEIVKMEGIRGQIPMPRILPLIRQGE